MGTTTFNGPVRSENGFTDISKSDTGVITSTRTVTAAQMTAGTGISTGTGTVYDGTVTKTVMGDVTYFYTRIYIDLTGLDDGGTTLDIIGVDGGTANCHLGQITAAVNGTIYAGAMTCLEAPLTGGADIDLYSATEATGAQDAVVTGLTETALLNAATSTLNKTDALTAWPAADEYLYLAGVTASDATYTAGKLLIELWGAT